MQAARSRLVRNSREAPGSFISTPIGSSAISISTLLWLMEMNRSVWSSIRGISSWFRSPEGVGVVRCLPGEAQRRYRWRVNLREVGLVASGRRDFTASLVGGDAHEKGSERYCPRECRDWVLGVVFGFGQLYLEQQEK